MLVVYVPVLVSVVGSLPKISISGFISLWDLVTADGMDAIGSIDADSDTLL